MTTLTPNYSLILYNSTTDASANFATWRADIDGPASTSNFYKIDTALAGIQSQVTSLQNASPIVVVPSLLVTGVYTATGITGITAYTTNLLIVLSLDTTSSGAVILNINSLGNRNVMKINSSGSATAMTNTELRINKNYLFKYDGTQWIWVNAVTGSQINIDGTSGNVLTVNTDNTILGTTTPAVLIASTTDAATSKTTPVSADELPLADSAASFILKKLTIGNLFSVLGTFIDGFTSKTTPVGADEFAIADSAASFLVKKLTLTNLVAALKTLIATDTLAATTDITTNNATSSAHGFLPKLSGNIADTFRGDGSYGGIYAPEGFLQNGKLSVTVASNNITVAIKTLAGANPSATDPVYIRINGVIRVLTAALSVTKNAGTNWFNSGASETATKEMDYFCYLGFNATDGVTIGFARIPYATSYGDFSVTTTNEKYAAISTITNAVSTDYYVVIGRFAATLSATASFNWSVPTFTAVNLIDRPIYAARWNTWVPTIGYNGGTTDPTSNTVSTAKFYINDRNVYFSIVSALVRGTGNRTSTTFTLPFTTANVTVCSGADTISTAGILDSLSTSINGATITHRQTMSLDGTYYIDGFYTLA